MASKEFDTVYLTKELAQRLAAVAFDALVGVQIHTNAADDSVVLVDMVDIDSSEMRNFRIDVLGEIVETT